MKPALQRWYLRIALAAVILVHLVVLAGSIVRATGSGMGCPDWPKCYGQFIPPTHPSQVSAEYLAKHPEVVYAGINIAKTWTEYINRVIGMFNGLALLAFVALSCLFWKQDKWTPLILIFGIVLFGIVAWMGKKVVDEHLHPRTVTIHMLGGLMLVTATVVASTRVCIGIKQIQNVSLPMKLRQLLWLALGAVVLQVVVGTQMREGVDHLLAAGDCCGGTLEKDLGAIYQVHRIVAALVAFSVGGAFLWLRMLPGRPLAGWTRALGFLVGTAYVVGVALVRFELPAYLQPAHLVLATLLLSVLVVVLMVSRKPQEA